MTTRLSQSGVALAIVLWFVAGMSLLVAGIVSQASVDTRMAQLHAARARVAAAGDGATQLFMLDSLARRGADARSSAANAGRYRLGDLDVTVSLVPTSGLIDLNSAPAPVLVALFDVAAGLAPADAQYIADNVVNWRTPKASRGIQQRGGAKFTEIEDLLRVEGVGRTLLDGVRDYVAAGSAIAGGTDWSLAPAAVLAVLEKSDAQRFDSVSRRREKMAQRAESSPGQAPGVAAGGSYRMDAVLRYGDRAWLRRSWLVQESGSQSLLPWRVLRSEAPRVIGD